MNKKQSVSKVEYDKLLKSGMFWEFYPELTGDYDKDKLEWKKIFKTLKRNHEQKDRNNEPLY